MALVVDTVSSFYRIREHTRHEFVAASDVNGNILRWGETRGDDQVWLFVPVGDRRYRIMGKLSGQYMAVTEPIGDIRIWGLDSDATQVFRLVNEDAQGRTVNIVEPTRNHFVSIGSNGNVCRWEKATSPESQLFTLEPWRPGEPPPLPAIDCEPGKIGDIPRLTKLDPTGLPVDSEPKIVAASLVPASMVDDSSYSDKIVQMERNPYYIAVRRQFWSRRERVHGYTYEHTPGEEYKFERTVSYEVLTRSSRTSEETWGFKFSINGEIASSKDTKDGKGSKASAGMELEISHQMRVAITEETNIVESDSQTVTRHYDASQPKFVVIGWSLVDLYSLYKADGETLVSEVEAGANGSLRKDSWPSDVPQPE